MITTRAPDGANKHTFFILQDSIWGPSFMFYLVFIQLQCLLKLAAYVFFCRGLGFVIKERSLYNNLVTKNKVKIYLIKDTKTKCKKNLFRLTPSLFISPNNFKTNFWCKLWTKINFVHSWLNLCRNPSIKAKSSQQNMNNYFCKAFSFHFISY